MGSVTILTLIAIFAKIHAKLWLQKDDAEILSKEEKSEKVLLWNPRDTVHNKLVGRALRLLHVHCEDVDATTLLKRTATFVKRIRGSFPSCCSFHECAIPTAPRKLAFVKTFSSLKESDAIGFVMRSPRDVTTRHFGKRAQIGVASKVPRDISARSQVPRFNEIKRGTSPTYGSVSDFFPKISYLFPTSSPTGKWFDMVQRDFLAEVDLELAATLVELPVMFSDESDGRRFNFDRWEQHRNPSRYGRLLIGTLVGVTSRRIITTNTLLVVFTFLVGLYSEQAKAMGMPELQLPLVPFELTAPVLGYLLVFRTNSAYERFDRGSDAAWELTSQMRSTIRQLALFTSGPEVPRHEREATVELIDACCLLHALVMGSYLRGDPEAGLMAALLHLTLGRRASNDQDALAVGLTPSAAATALSVAIRRRLPSLDSQMLTSIDSHLSDVTSSLGICEKLLSTPIPIGYTRYAVRFLWIWLTLLPFALVNTFSKFAWSTSSMLDTPQPVLMLAMGLVGFIFLSIEDIAVQIEEPFKVLPLERHQQWLDHEAKQIKTLLMPQTDKEYDTVDKDHIALRNADSTPVRHSPPVDTRMH